ncbi:MULTISPECIES: methylated-DNA--[protein]-cysteine S-methyltransferase [Bradyrhizobium]|uniref:methylated-DNA--[protein]-cysteine S-methyltransferase n=1 Tax=Bradyrhizobium TaxID=374 RepID=UPI0020113D89|nr:MULTISPECIES: methylated-DNA--[protein]-cysteine S-methyltransferase [Bradyrhizobium]
METPLGVFHLVADGEGRLRAADFADCESRLQKSLSRQLGVSHVALVQGTLPQAIPAALRAYFSGQLDAIAGVPLKASGSPFQERVWRELRSVDPGAPLPYAALAARLGKPDAARAVGHANGANPFCVVVPCHRLIGGNGKLTGYSGGLERKRWLLAHEARYAMIRLPPKSG